MKQPARQRIDQLLVERGLAESRSKAQALILAGSVLVNEQKVEKAGQMVSTQADLRLLDQLRYVSRGGLKLEGALDHWNIHPSGWTCIDIGSSTGGFVDCLLQRGAARVYSVDVGPTQLDWKIRTDPRVVVKDHTNARALQPGDIGEPCRLLVCDVSFISVTLILPAMPSLLTADGEMVILVKPQFEVGREAVGKGGIVRDPRLHEAACHKVREAVTALGFHTDLIDSPIQGAEGNREFLLHATH
ncbi:MAG: TlyA family RNA methyltransferase [Bryobacteraceae bacterium]|nr:TlyA family RNA methyltransferase [Bryobacteraceae bacterium]